MFYWIRANPTLVYFVGRWGCIPYWLLLTVATHWPLPGVVLPHHSDKMIHIVAYTGLAFFLGLRFQTGRLKIHRWQRATGLVVGLWAVVDELTQIPIPGRSGDVLDCLADWAGCGLGIICAQLVMGLVKPVEPRTRD